MDDAPLNARPTLAPRLLMGIVAPATNTTVQPEMEALRPAGVINAQARIPNPDRRVAGDAEQRAVRAEMVAGLGAALDTLAPARPSHVILAVMVENFVGDGAAGAALIADAEARAGAPVTATTHAILAALAALGARRVAMLSPFMAEGERAARRFLEEAGHDVVRAVSLRAPGPEAISRVPRARIEAALREVDGRDVEAIVQVGTNLPFAEIAVSAEAALAKPVLASNPVAYWHALRRAGIDDRRTGAGRLFTEF